MSLPTLPTAGKTPVLATPSHGAADDHEEATKSPDSEYASDHASDFLSSIDYNTLSELSLEFRNNFRQRLKHHLSGNTPNISLATFGASCFRGIPFLCFPTAFTFDLS
jgi:hypothetical protein